jgi:hypothetical protein
VTETATPAAGLGASARCAHCPAVDSDLTGLLGHDPLAHRTLGTLLRYGVETREQLARLTTLDLLLMRSLGHHAVDRIRETVPEPPNTAASPVVFTPAPPVFFDDQAAGDPSEVTDADRLSLALLARLPAEADVAPAMLADSESAAALWALTAVSRTDPRIWRHVHATRIAFPRVLEEPGFSTTERMLLRLARSLAACTPHMYVGIDLPGLALALDDDQWRALLTALQVRRAGLRGTA